jgi:uncharacterized protein YukE
MEPSMELTKKQMMQIIVDQRAEMKALRTEMETLRSELATANKTIQTLLAENVALRAQVTDAWRGHLSRSVAGALAESAAHRRSLVTGRCVP